MLPKSAKSLAAQAETELMQAFKRRKLEKISPAISGSNEGVPIGEARLSSSCTPEIEDNIC